MAITTTGQAMHPASKKQHHCTTCGKEFFDWPSQRKSRPFCGNACYHESLRGKVPHNKGVYTRRSSKPCANCGKDIAGEKSFVDKRKFCSQKCFGEAYRGEAHPYWRGGCGWRRELFRTPEYKAWRKAVLVRDQGICRWCDSIGVRNKKLLEVHHIIPASEDRNLAVAVGNGITLCRAHHKSVTGRESEYANVLFGLAGVKPLAEPTNNPSVTNLFSIGKEDLERMYTSKRMSTYQIGRECGYDPTTVQKYLRRYGIPTRPAQRHRKQQEAV